MVVFGYLQSWPLWPELSVLIAHLAADEGPWQRWMLQCWWWWRGWGEAMSGWSGWAEGMVVECGHEHLAHSWSQHVCVSAHVFMCCVQYAIFCVFVCVC